MDYKEISKQEYYVNPFVTGYGTLPTYLQASFTRTEAKVFDGTRPKWLPDSVKMRKYLMDYHWGAEYKSRSLKWVIGHNGSPLSEDSIQIDHIIPWEVMRNYLKVPMRGDNGKHTPFKSYLPLPSGHGFIKGIDYIDDPEVSEYYGEDVLYRFTNIAAIKYYHTIENLRPLPGSINSKRNNKSLSSQDLRIVDPEKINTSLNKKLAELAATVEEYTSQVVHLYADNFDSGSERRKIWEDQLISDTQELIESISRINRRFE